jgi:hypothetical protein
MKCLSLLLAVLALSCGQNQKNDEAATAAKEEARIEYLISSLHEGFARAYNEGGVDTDSLMDVYFDRGVQYVAPWGWTEPIDSTKARLRNAMKHVKDYTARIEALHVRVFGRAGYAYFILRQNTTVDGTLLEEYLPTTFILEQRDAVWKIVHAHRSTDYQTFEQWIAMQKKNIAGK